MIQLAPNRLPSPVDLKELFMLFAYEYNIFPVDVTATPLSIRVSLALAKWEIMLLLLYMLDFEDPAIRSYPALYLTLDLIYNYHKAKEANLADRHTSIVTPGQSVCRTVGDEASADPASFLDAKVPKKANGDMDLNAVVDLLPPPFSQPEDFLPQLESEVAQIDGPGALAPQSLNDVIHMFREHCGCSGCIGDGFACPPPKKKGDGQAEPHLFAKSRQIQPMGGTNHYRQSLPFTFRTFRR